MEFGDLLNARLVCHEWKIEADFYIRRRNNMIAINTNTDLYEYLKLDRTLYPFVKFDLTMYSPCEEVLDKCDLKGIQHLFLEAIIARQVGDIWNSVVYRGTSTHRFREQCLKRWNVL